MPESTQGVQKTPPELTLELAKKVFQDLAPSVKEQYDNSPEKFLAAMHDERERVEDVPAEKGQALSRLLKGIDEAVSAMGKEIHDEYMSLMNGARTGV
jgi:hypothetical protein